MPIRRAGVIGAGTMGAAIAALLAGAGLSVVLLDLPPERLTADEAAAGLTLADRRVRNRIAEAGFARMRAARPANLFRPSDAERITVGNTADDLALLADCDWVIEVIVERLDAKRELLARIEPIVRADAVVTTNTSGIPIAAIAAECAPDFQRRFFGTHFFNPPRYLKLLELVAGPTTDPALLEEFAAFAAERLGKGVVFCHDRPNFIGNRIFAYSALRVLNYALDHQCRVDDVDALTGPLIGRPSTASFRLLDAVGLDVMRHVTDNLAESVPEDESCIVFQPHPLLNRLIADGRLGRKSGQGFYREVRSEGRREFQVLDLQSLQYVPSHAFAHAAELQQVTRSLPTAERIRFLLARAAADPADDCANLIAAAVYPTLAYAARRLPEIADSVADVDRAMRWGFAHELGPFELWQALGIRETAAALHAYGETLPGWVEQLISNGLTFYQTGPDGLSAYHVPSGSLRALPRDPRALTLTTPLADTDLYDLGAGVAALAWPAGGSLYDARLAARLSAALAIVNRDENLRGLVILPADGRLTPPRDQQFLEPLLLNRDTAALRTLLERTHALLDAVQRSARPVVFAAAGRLQGSTLSLAWHCHARIAAIETMVGLTDAEQGLVPLASAAAALNRRLIAAAPTTGDALGALSHTIHLIATARLAGSATEAQELGLLNSDDRVVFHPDFLAGEARALLLGLAPPLPPSPTACLSLNPAERAIAYQTIAELTTAGHATPSVAALRAWCNALSGPSDSSGRLSEATLRRTEIALAEHLAQDEALLARLQTQRSHA